jgi:tetratricopeptide (TPR) repeat protein
MKKSIRPYFFIISLACFIGIGCNSSDQNTNDGLSILKSPLFNSINDSIRQFPQDADLYLHRARLLSQNNAHEIAYADYKKSWELQPSKETGLYYAANLSIVGKSMDKQKLLHDCIQKFPDDPEFKRLLGETFMETGQSKMALGIYDGLLQKDSLDFESWYEKGLLLQQLKDTPQAIIALRKAWSLQPVNTYALELAHVYAETKNPFALKICDYVLASDSSKEIVDPFFIKGIYYSNTQEYNEAIMQFDSCIQRDWKFTDAYIEKGIAFFKQKNYDEALNSFHLATTVSNTDPDAYYWMGRCYEVINKKEEAIAFYERAVALDKNFKEAKEAIKRLKG